VTLGMAVESTTVTYGVAVFTGREIHAERTVRRDDPEFASIGALAETVLTDAGRTFTELGLLAVNAGPGNLTSVRAGVAYVNGLAFSVGAEVVSADALTLLAREVAPELDEPVLVLRNAGTGNAYAGLFRADADPVLRHGPLEAVVRELAGSLPSLYCAGVFREQARMLLPDATVKDTGIDTSSVLTLHDLVTTVDLPRAAFATPITDSSVVFCE
jgi:tRNA threonylcarbamoyl adenosine modification protein YeaZ